MYTEIEPGFEELDRAIGETMLETLTAYIKDGRPTGDFTRAVLSNDLKEACGHADHENRYRLFEIVSWLYNKAPSACWGSPDAVKVWLSAHADRRAKEALEAREK